MAEWTYDSTTKINFQKPKINLINYSITALYNYTNNYDHNKCSNYTIILSELLIIILGKYSYHHLICPHYYIYN